MQKPSTIFAGGCMLDEAQIQTYLDRIAYTGPRVATLDVLTALHVAHLQHIPFENLDISLGHKLDLSTPALLDKLLQQRRGGFCYELNQAFRLLLQSFGFQTSLIAARVFNGKDYGPDFDHMLIQVQLDGQGWIADVGFGDSFRTPLTMNGQPITELGMQYQVQPEPGLEPTTACFKLMQGRDNKSMQPQFHFSLQAFEIDDFAAMCLYQQTSPLSHFTQKTICSIATPQGRISISNNKCISTERGVRQVHSMRDENEYRALLQQHFGIHLTADADIQKLMARHPV
ncbi:arylamine N-acetyltransferase family protein [Undibacterium sp. Di26W]|uniref:arylamine N-acetyltransferase family protein n=1 Tax=Undibacterium sp. Di26W TaxID=3413035 RepID=UPI003BF2D7F9